MYNDHKAVTVKRFIGCDINVLYTLYEDLYATGTTHPYMLICLQGINRALLHVISLLTA